MNKKLIDKLIISTFGINNYKIKELTDHGSAFTYLIKTNKNYILRISEIK